MSQTEVLNIIDKISNRYCEKFKFGYLTGEDIKQEAYFIAVDGLERYDGSTSLENFLAVHIRNRLLSFKRDNYHRCEKTMTEKGLRLNEKKKALMHPISFDYVDDESETNMQTSSSVDFISDKLLLEYIDDNIRPEFREDYLRIKDGVAIQRIRKELLIQHIIKLVREYGGGKNR